MSEKIRIFITALLAALCLALCVSCFTACGEGAASNDPPEGGSTEPPEADVPEEPIVFGDEWMSGEILTLDEAYERALIDRDDLLSIAYYYDPDEDPNEYPDGFTADPLSPDSISEELERVIETACTARAVADNVGAESDNVRLWYLGRYGDCIALKILRTPDGLHGPGSLHYDLIVDGVVFGIGINMIYPLIWHKV